jgi:hypothetical protein
MTASSCLIKTKKSPSSQTASSKIINLPKLSCP